METPDSETKSNDPLLPQAKTLVDTARAAAIRTYKPMVDQFPSVLVGFAAVQGETKWELIVTTASVYIASARLRNLELGDSREQLLMTEVSAQLEAWDSVNALPCFENCKTFFGPTFEQLTANGNEPRFISSDTLGLWIAWNILGRAPKSEDEGRFVRTIGVAITHGFFNWWGKE